MYQPQPSGRPAYGGAPVQAGRVDGSNGSGNGEVLIFRDYSGWEEPALSTPFGFMSLRNLVVFGLFGLLTYALYATVLPDSLSVGRDYLMLLAVLSPLIVGLCIAIIKTPYGTADTIIAALLVMIIRRRHAARRHGRDKQKKKKKKRARKSRVLGFARPLEVDAPSTDRIHEITCADLDELKSIRITIYAADGSVMSGRLVKCYLDDVLIDSIHTGSDGSLVMHVRPEREGGRTLMVRDHTDDRILLQRPLHFALNRTTQGSSR